MFESMQGMSWRRLRSVVVAAVAAIVLVGCGGDGAGGERFGPDRVPYVVRASLGVGATAEDVAARLGGEVVLWRPESGFAVVGVDAVPDGLAPTERAEPSRDAVATPVAATQAGGIKIWSGGHKIWSGGEGVTAIAADNGAVWAQIGLDEARALAPAAGAGVLVAVLDTGIDVAHPAFVGSLADPGDWYDFVDEDRMPDEPQGAAGAGFGHGTAVAALVLQVAPGATLLPLRVLDTEGVGDLAALLRAIDHAVERGARILNLSLGTLDDSDALRAVVDHAASRGVFVVASAGNTGDDRITFPAAIDDDLTVGVGSVGAEDAKSDFSTFGEHLTMVAPGEALWTAFPGEAAAHWSGTSMAAPLVSGAIALALGERGGTDAEALREALLRTLADVDELEVNRDYGDDLGGRIDVAAFLRAAGDEPSD